MAAHIIQLILHFPEQEAVQSLEQAVLARAALKRQVSHPQPQSQLQQRPLPSGREALDREMESGHNLEFPSWFSG